MGWVVDGIIARVRQENRIYAASEWDRFCEDHGLTVLFTDLPASLPAFFLGKAIVIQHGLSRQRTARLVWHEIGHWMCHAGSREFWRARPLGYLILSKMERQANEFAQQFPEWDWNE